MNSNLITWQVIGQFKIQHLKFTIKPMFPCFPNIQAVKH